MTKHTEQN